MIYEEVIWSYYYPKKRLPNILYLTKKDINHLGRIYNKYDIEPESIGKVRIRFLSDRVQLLRFIIKELDILLSTNGKFIIESTYSADHGVFVRSIDQIRYEFSISTGGRFKNTACDINGNITRLEYIKCVNILSEEDRMERWSFGIITNGKNSQQVTNAIESIRKLEIPCFEVIICGEYEVSKNIDNVNVIDDVKNHDDIRAPITQKKNKIAVNAKYNNLIIMHDRYLFPSDWYFKMKKYGNYFELLSMPNIGPNDGRISDWNVFSTHPSRPNRFDLILPKYTSWSPWWYVQGGILIVKRNMFLELKLDERLHWGELEDVQFSQIASLKGWFYYLDISNHVKTSSIRLPESNASTSNIFYILRLVRALFITIEKIAKNITFHYINRKS